MVVTAIQKVPDSSTNNKEAVENNGLLTLDELAKLLGKQLKAMFDKKGVMCKGCSEKIDFVNRVFELMLTGSWNMVPNVQFSHPSLCAADRGGHPYAVMIDHGGREPRNYEQPVANLLEEEARVVMPLTRLSEQPMVVSNSQSALHNAFTACKQRGAVIVLVIMIQVIYNLIKLCADSVSMSTQCVKFSIVEKTPRGMQTNVLMKLNMKMGGVNHTLTSRGRAAEVDSPVIQKPPNSISCMVVGVYVNRPDNMSRDASVAAVVASMDGMMGQYACYVATCEKAGEPNEVLETAMHHLLQAFARRNQGNYPKRIIFYRDGVADNQFPDILNRVISALKNDSVKISIVVCKKKHHTRLVYQQGAGGEYMNPCVVGLCVDGTQSAARNGDPLYSICSPVMSQDMVDSYDGGSSLISSKPLLCLADANVEDSKKVIDDVVHSDDCSGKLAVAILLVANNNVSPELLSEVEAQGCAALVLVSDSSVTSFMTEDSTTTYAVDKQRDELTAACVNANHYMLDVKNLPKIVFPVSIIVFQDFYYIIVILVSMSTQSVKSIQKIVKSNGGRQRSSCHSSPLFKLWFLYLSVVLLLLQFEVSESFSALKHSMWTHRASFLNMKIQRKEIESPFPDKSVLQEHLVKDAKRGVTKLCKVIGYQGKEASVTRVGEHIQDMWSRAQSLPVPHKEDVPLLCTFGPSGQGKSELCRQLVIELGSSASFALKNVDVILPIIVSFGEGTTYSKSEDKNIIDAFIRRALKTCDSRYANNPDKIDSLKALLTLLRGEKGNRACVLFLVDGLQKVPEKPRNELIDLMNSFVQSQLMNRLPAFWFVTCSRVQPVRHHVATECRRPLAPICLSTLESSSSEEIANKLSDQFINIIALSTPLDEKDVADCRRVIRAIVSVSGLHFRTLETSLKYVYSQVVTRENHEKALVNGLIALGKPQKTVVDANPWSNIRIRSAFGSDITKEYPEDAYDSCMKLFLRTILDPDLRVTEADYIDLEDKGLLLVKTRTLDDEDSSVYGDLSMIVPRVSLPFLYHKFDSLHRKMGWTLNPKGYLEGSRPSSLEVWSPLLMHNIGQALYSSSNQLSHTLQRVVPWIEMMRILALKSDDNACIILDDVLPGAVVRPWSDSDKSIEVDLMFFGSSMRVEGCLPPESSYLLPPLTSVKLIEMLENEKYIALIRNEGKHETPANIEYVSRFYSNGNPLTAAGSVVKYETESPVKESQNIHSLLSSAMKPGSYYAFVYCLNDDLPSAADLPPGTVVVGYQTLKKMLQPFGASHLLDIMKETKSVVC